MKWTSTEHPTNPDKAVLPPIGEECLLRISRLPAFGDRFTFNTVGQYLGSRTGWSFPDSLPGDWITHWAVIVEPT